MSSTIDHLNQGDLVTSYQDLPDEARQILQLLSVAMDVGSAKSVAELAKLSALRAARSKRAFTFIQIKQSLKLLEGQGLIFQASTGYTVVPLIANPVLYLLGQQDPTALKRIADAVRVKTENSNRFFFDFYSTADGRVQIMRNLRVAYFLKDKKSLTEEIDKRQRYMDGNFSLWIFVSRPFIPELFYNLPEQIRDPLFYALHLEQLTNLLPSDQLHHDIAKIAPSAPILNARVERLIFTGQLKQAESLAQKTASNSNANIRVVGAQILGWLSFISNQDDKSIKLYELAFSESKSDNRQRKKFPFGLSGLFFILALCRRGTAADLKRAGTLVKWGEELAPDEILNFMVTLGALVSFKLGEESNADMTLSEVDVFLDLDGNGIAFLQLIHLYITRWIKPEDCNSSESVEKLRDIVKICEQNNYQWIETLAIDLLLELDKKSKAQWGKRLKKLKEGIDLPCHSILSLAPYQEKWERSLNALELLAGSSSAKNKSASAPAEKVHMWALETYESQNYSHLDEELPGTSLGWNLTPLEQSRLKSGKMGKIKRVALSRLANSAGKLGHLTEQDRAACQFIRSTHSRWGGTDYYIESSKALLTLVGHPHLFTDDSASLPLELVLKQPELSLSKVGSTKIKIQLLPEANYSTTHIHLVQDTPTRLVLIPIESAHQKIFSIISADGLVLPKSSIDRALESLAALSSSVRVQSQVSSDKITAADTIKANSTPVLHLFPQRDGLIAELYVQPIQPDGDHFYPGKGGKVIFGRDKNGNLQTTRDFSTEIKTANKLITQCASLNNFQSPDTPYTWSFDDPESSLDLLVDLQELPDGTIQVLWPKGEAFNLRAVIGSSNFNLSLKKQENNWLEASGKLKVDKDLVLSMKEIMLLLEEQAGQKFIQLKSGQFLALGKTFRQKLDDLRLLSTASKNNARTIHPLAALALEDLADDENNTCNAEWKKHLKQLKKIKSFEAKLPSTLQAELRPYQLEGFQWLARLAEWGAGACLADDMGLGKTVQALALLLHRAKGGPALIVAPTSVAANWVNETLKFAPTLNPLRFAGKQNAQLLKNLKARDMVITTYGMLQQEDSPLLNIDWHSVVLDEAQAIKNRSTKRAKAAKNLKAAFRIVTTGTPIENHLGELHSLFDFINPGLLGSADHFRKRFAEPIELHNHVIVRNSLRRVVSPFILRRLKTEVLQDLPARTEITLDVEMSQEESAFYEALRQNAVETLAGETPEPKNAGEKSFQIFAAITRLRQACCNPALVQKSGAPESSKLQVFTDTVTEILEGNHKVLVFSQFVSHLAILKKRLEKLGISYQYLDGSIPVKKRQKSIDDFQNGEGDVFLISLKAGGSGLNLTAADYVIHMDPWWNPAVEDQASDRAHRIGQQRPVTIYRLVTKNTIEEKIVALHHQKRDLADSLLAGTDQAARLSAEDMLKLIQEA